MTAPVASKSSSLLGSAPQRGGTVAIVGGGISGLCLAHQLHRAAASPRFEVLEGSSRFGGNIRTERVGDFLFDAGPDSFLRTRPEGVELCRELGLSEELITPEPTGRAVYIARDGRLEQMPDGLSLGVPMSLAALLDCPSLSPLGKGRALLEPLVPQRQGREEESIAGFLRRRLGSEVAERLAAPLLSGVFAGDAERLSIDAAFPQLVALERGHGSLLRGMLRGRSWTTVLRKPSSESPFVTPRAGLERVIERLVEELPPAVLQLQCPIERIDYDGGEYRLHSPAGERRAAAVVLAVPPWQAARLLEPGTRRTPAEAALGAVAEELGAVRWSATATVFFAFAARDVDFPLDGSGFIVPEGEGQILAATWISSKWAERAPRGRVLLRAFLGGARRPELLERPDAELTDLALGELRRFMGPLGRPSWSRVYRYQRGNPQPELGHLGRLARVRALLPALPGLFFVGAGYGGVGIPDCIRQAREAARLLLEEPPTST
jgi:oxygen-dependent protoporphyrinogen oxidase